MSFVVSPDVTEADTSPFLPRAESIDGCTIVKVMMLLANMDNKMKATAVRPLKFIIPRYTAFAAG
ncbi:hypothetical protein D3C73_1654760 [compost metagenome]